MKSNLSRHQSQSGAAIMTALCLTVVILTLGIASLSLAEQNYFLSKKQEMKARSYYLALSGIEYYWQEAAMFRVGVPATRAVPLGSSTQFFEVSVDAANTIQSKGMIRNGSNAIVEETVLVVPEGNMERVYDARN